MRGKEIPIGLLIPGGSWQPREDAKGAKIDELAATITATNGLIQPIVVRQRGAELDGYDIVAGERRWRACKTLGYETVPCLVRDDLSDQEAAAYALVENIAREDLSPVEIGRALIKMREQYGFRQADIAAVIGTTRDQISRLMGISKLPIQVQGLIHDGDLSLGAAKCLLTTRLTPAQKVSLATEAADKKWTVAHLAIEVNRARNPSEAPRHLEQTAMALGEAIQSKCTLAQKGNGTYELTVHSFAPQTLSGVLERLTKLIDDAGSVDGETEVPAVLRLTATLEAFDFLAIVLDD